jgi:hypothetical protein
MSKHLPLQVTNNSFTLKSLRRPALLFALSLLLLVALGACSAKTYTVEKMPMPHLSYGSGGGVTGIVSEYCLLQNGQIVEKQRQADKTEIYRVIKKIDADEAKRMMALTDSMQLRRVIFTEPGDLYYYLTMHDANGETHKITWGKPEKTVRTDIEKFYKTLIAFLSNQKG